MGKLLGKYDLPGGGVEKYENVQEALKREYFEETGVDVEVGEIVDIKSNFFIMPTTKEPLNSFLMYIFI